MAPAIAGLGVVMVASAGMALDVGLHYVDNRDLHAATEAAALDAAMNPAQAQSRAQAYLTKNGFDAAVIQSVQTGRYCADSALAATQRFDTTYTRCGTGAANAVRISTRRESRRYLSAILGDAVIPDIESTATAARIDEAGLGITSGIVTVSNSLVLSVNNLLGALLGVQLSLNASEIQALMSGSVDAGLFFDKLAARESKTGTYNELVQGSYGIKNIALSAAEATSNAATKAALNTFAAQVTNNYKVPLKDLFGLGVWKNMPVGESDQTPGLRAGLNAYQLLSYAVQAGPGSIDASDLVRLVLPANPNAVVKVTAVATGTVDRPRFSFGPAGDTKVGTSALRLQLQLADLAVNVAGLINTTINLPVLIDIGAAQAEIVSANGIDCTNTSEQRANTRVTVAAQSGFLYAYVGNAPANAMTKPMPAISYSDITQASLINSNVQLAGLPLLTITAKTRATASPVLGQSRNLVFGPGGDGTIGTPSAPGTAGLVGNGSQIGTTISTLGTSVAGGVDVDVTGPVGNLCLLCGLTTKENSLLSAVTPAITTPLGQLVGNTADPLLDNVLAALGVQLGYAAVSATGARCGVPVLV